MILAAHILVAISGIIASSLAALLPSKFKINLSAILVTATLASGFYLVWSTKQHLLQSCVSGLVYLAVTSTGIIIGWHKLRTSQTETQD